VQREKKEEKGTETDTGMEEDYSEGVEGERREK